MTSLQAGTTYRIRVEAKNSIGYSEYSNVIEAIAAIVPTATPDPTTIMDVNNVIVDWSAPTSDSEAAYGSAVIGYKIFIRW